MRGHLGCQHAHRRVLPTPSTRLRALVTGATGFVGRHLVEHLVAEGDEVVATGRSTGGPDLLNTEGIGDLLNEVHPEVVFHLAGQADVAHSWTEPVKTFRTNGEGTFNLLSAAREVGVDRVVTIISSDVYGLVPSEDLPVAEDAPFRPNSPYAVSKAMADLVAQQAHLGFGQDVIRARPFSHFGAGQGENAVCSALAARVARSELDDSGVIRVGNLHAKRDFTNVRDVVRSYRLLAVQGQAGSAYNVCTGISTSIGTVLDVFLSHAERPLRVVSDPALFRPVDLSELFGDGTRIEEDTGWSPQCSLESGLLELLNDWRYRLRQVGVGSPESQIVKDRS